MFRQRLFTGMTCSLIAFCVTGSAYASPILTDVTVPLTNLDNLFATDFDGNSFPEVVLTGLILTGFNPGNGFPGNGGDNIGSREIRAVANSTPTINVGIHGTALAAGELIDGSLTYTSFTTGSFLEVSQRGACSGSFCPAGVSFPPGNPGPYFIGAWSLLTDGYMGVQFQIDGNTHFGWIQIDVDTLGAVGDLSTDAIYAIIRSYAYESQPGVGILAGAGAVPEPATFSLLLLGLLPLNRRQR